MSWDAKFMNLAKEVGSWSKDRSRQLGCVIVGRDYEVRTIGYNGFPRGVNDDVDSRHERPAKYRWTEHAERNAIYNAARIGTPIDGCIIYLSWYPCMDCSRAIIQSGITEVVALKPDWQEGVWGDDFLTSKEMFEEVGITVRFVDP